MYIRQRLNFFYSLIKFELSRRSILHRALIVIICSTLFYSCGQNDNIYYIDPTIGNVSLFLVPTYPTMHLPNQMLRMIPLKEDYLSDEIEAFPLQITKHRGDGIFQMKVVYGELNMEAWDRKMAIDHDLEEVHPWYYSTYLIEDDVRVSFTPGSKCGIFKFENRGNNLINLLFTGSRDFKAWKDKDGAIRMEEKIAYTRKGNYSKTRETTVYLYAILTDKYGSRTENYSLDGGSRRLAIRFTGKGAPKIFLKYAVSYISPEQAKFNFNAELAKVDFDMLVNSSRRKWQDVIDQVKVEGGTESQKRSFYTALYRTRERMIDINEYGKYYSGYDGKVHESDQPFYVDDWIWDTYLALHPLRTILDPEMESDILRSYTQMYQQSGWMPTFPQLLGNHMCMNSYHSSSIFLDGYRKGLTGFDIEAAYEGIKKNLLEGTYIPWRQGTPRRPIDDFFFTNGYFPSLRPGETETEPQVDSFEKRQPVSVTLGISYDFWVLSELARSLGRTEDYEEFSLRAKDYQNLWHSSQQLFIPKDELGNWIDINPKIDGGPGYRNYYDENNGWTYGWDVKHDIEGLTGLLGGKAAAEERLDQLFREPLGLPKRDFYVDGSNSTGMIGQFSMGNEPSFHIPYLYNYFGAAWKTQKKTRFLLDVWFKDNIFGIPGDEDGGGMSGFVVLSSIGIYPVTPGIPVYTITSPLFEKVSIQLHNGKVFTVVAKGADKRKKYIQKAFINGKEIYSPFITHDQVMSGATLELELAETPNKDWGKNAKIPEE